MEFASLGSGSKGNATLLRSGETCILVDCGFSLKHTVARLDRAGVRPEQLDAVLVTHEHGDHIRGVAALARRYRIPVFCTRGTAAAGKLDPESMDIRYVNPERSFSAGEFSVTPVAVPHDAREPCQYIFCCGENRLGLLSDCGYITPHILRQYQNCQALLLECNHDLDMLRAGPYPPSLKKRVGGLYGHLNNHQAAEFLAGVNHHGLQTVIVTHISEKNNHPEKAVDCLRQAAAQIHEFPVIDQELGLDWVNLLCTKGSHHEERQVTVFG